MKLASLSSYFTLITPAFSEPEAAAVHCAHLTNLHQLRPSQNFMICDAGGGTVVCISYFLVSDFRTDGACAALTVKLNLYV